MKRIIYILILLLATNSCKKENNTDYIDYYRAINQAEQFISNSDHQSALGVYDAIFVDYKNVFYKDLHNACVCAIETKQYDRAFELIESLVKHGYELEDFAHPIFLELKKMKPWSNFMSSYPTLRQEYLESLDYDMRSRYLDMRKKDKFATEVLESVHEKDSAYTAISNDLLEEIQTNGFPSFLHNKDSLINKTYIIMRHICGFANAAKHNKDYYKDAVQINNATTIKKLAKEALHKGFINPVTYMEIVTYNDTNPYGTIGVQIDFETEKTYPIFPNEKDSDIALINQRRDSIGLFLIKEDISAMNLEEYKNYPFKEIKQRIKEELQERHDPHEKMRIVIETGNKYSTDDKPKFKLNSQGYKGIYYKGL